MNKRTTYTISRNHETITTVYGRSHHEAAKAYARKTYGRMATAFRTTGGGDLSGYFRAYEPGPNGQGWNSTGDAFHVSEGGRV